MQRQADAVVMWAELTGKHAKTASYEGSIKFLAKHPEGLGAAIGAPVGAGKAYLDYREGGGGISKAEAAIHGSIAEARSRGVKGAEIDKLKAHLQTAKSRRENIVGTTVGGAALGAGAGALTGFLAKKRRAK
jgi:hypothetical protein